MTDNDHLKKQNKLEQRASDALDESVDNIDAATLSQLRKRRQIALDSLDKKPKLHWWLGGAGMGLASAMALVVTLQTAQQVPAVNELDALDVVMAMDLNEASETTDSDMELMQDLAFIEWLQQQELADTSI